MTDTLARARALDAADPLRRFREEFVIADPELIYLDGNSLGRLPKRTTALLQNVVAKEWGEGLIRGYTDWFSLSERLGAKLAPLIGAQPEEVLVCESTSVNLYKLVKAALELTDRPVILTDEENFPSDWYVLRGIAQEANRQVSGAGPEALSESTALLTLSHVTFKSGRLNDMAGLTARAHAVGAYALWDLSHSVGAVPVHLNACGVDLAVGCTYKYLNGGPGAAAFLYVRRDLQEKLRNPIQGWFGRANAFDFGLEYQPRPGLARFLTGSPHVLSMAPVESGIDLVQEAGIENLRRKSLAQTDFLIDIWRKRLQPLGFTLNTPDEHKERGSHVSLGHPDALAIDLALIREEKVIPDFRTPDNIRFGCTPLYTTFEEIALAMERIESVVVSGRYKKYVGQMPTIT